MVTKITAMSKKSKLEAMNFMPDIEQASINNQNLKEMFTWGTQEYAFLSLDSIQFNPDNDYASEDTPDSIQMLAEDIERNGLLHNIVVSLLPSGEYKVLSGERRVRAYRYLLDTTHHANYQSIYALIKKGLTDRQERIILDAANLQTRGTGKEEKRYRKAGVRFIENLRLEFSITEQEAIQLAKEYLPKKEKTIDRNLELEKKLTPELLSLLDSGILSKNEAVRFLPLSSTLQRSAAVAIHGCSNHKEQSQTIASLLSLISRRKLLQENQARQEKALRLLSHSTNNNKDQMMKDAENYLQNTIQALKQNEDSLVNFCQNNPTQQKSSESDEIIRFIQGKTDRISDDMTELLRIFHQYPSLCFPSDLPWLSQIQTIQRDWDRIQSFILQHKTEKDKT